MDIQSLKRNPLFGVTQVLGPGYVGVTFNIANRMGRNAGPSPVGTPWAKDARVREAFDLSLDRAAINQQALGGEYVPGCTPISPATPFHPKHLKCPVRDVAAARKLLADAGYPGGLSLDLLVVDDAVQRRVGEAIQEMARDAGIQVRVKPTPFPDLLALQDHGQFEALLLGFVGRLDPDSVIFPFHTCRGALNFSFTCDPSLDTLLTKAQGEIDPAVRQVLYTDAVNKLMRSRAIVYLYHQKYTAAFSRRISGLESPPDGLLRLAGVHMLGSTPATGLNNRGRAHRSM
jgi:peptide/nickel transport system substrate-binding protein